MRPHLSPPWRASFFAQENAYHIGITRLSNIAPPFDKILSRAQGLFLGLFSGLFRVDFMRIMGDCQPSHITRA